ncbi:hypothetical protein CPC08DRAFT_756016 [Agrocybe pediades]|nr:hypothetical protein CPC08DRAFT_756016 [Agrocybe pediades]
MDFNEKRGIRLLDVLNARKKPSELLTFSPSAAVLSSTAFDERSAHGVEKILFGGRAAARSVKDDEDGHEPAPFAFMSESTQAPHNLPVIGQGVEWIVLNGRPTYTHPARLVIVQRPQCGGRRGRKVEYDKVSLRWTVLGFEGVDLGDGCTVMAIRGRSLLLAIVGLDVKRMDSGRQESLHGSRRGPDRAMGCGIQRLEVERRRGIRGAVVDSDDDVRGSLGTKETSDVIIEIDNGWQRNRVGGGRLSSRVRPKKFVGVILDDKAALLEYPDPLLLVLATPNPLPPLPPLSILPPTLSYPTSTSATELPTAHDPCPNLHRPTAHAPSIITLL